jgi:DNA-binding transcriptional ArsR family regulator
MIEYYELETLEQLRAVADLLRMRIIDALVERPMTVTQLGELLGLSPARIHYHVRELEKVGLLRLVETREKDGILEKYYQPIARSFGTQRRLFSAPLDEATAMLTRWLDQIRDGFLGAFRRLRQRGEQELLSNLNFGLLRLYLTPEESQQLAAQFLALCRPYLQRRSLEGEREILVSLLAYPPALDAAEASAASAEVAGGGPAIEEARVLGSVTFTRADLERVVAADRLLRLTVIGHCEFAEDIPSELAERAIAEFSLVGSLEAPPALREVLLRKQRSSGKGGPDAASD